MTPRQMAYRLAAERGVTVAADYEDAGPPWHGALTTISLFDKGAWRFAGRPFGRGFEISWRDGDGADALWRLAVEGLGAMVPKGGDDEEG